MSGLSFHDKVDSVDAVRQMLRLIDPVAQNASLAVHQNDDMLAFSVAGAGTPPLGAMAYFRAGWSMVNTSTP